MSLKYTFHITRFKVIKFPGYVHGVYLSKHFKDYSLNKMKNNIYKLEILFFHRKHKVEDVAASKTTS